MPTKFSVADPHHVDADPNPSFTFDADPDLCPTFTSDADPDPAPRKSDKVIRTYDHKPISRPSMAPF
jgi:hypothetical protein